jgi:hypothetical protein
MTARPLISEGEGAERIVGAASAHSTESSLREKIIEHLFIGELLRCLWRKGIHDVEVLRAEVDRSGYDLVFEAKGIVRHIQLKASHRLAKTAALNIHINLQNKPSACVIWILFDPDSMELGPYLWFGGRAGDPIAPLGDVVARHSKANSEGIKSERRNHRVVKKAVFERLSSLEQVAERLFSVTRGQ